ncbi:MAG: metallophosphoesterase [Candidatus Sulfotelmatobacter sp.]
MSPLRSFSTGRGAGKRQSHTPPIAGSKLAVQATSAPLPHYAFQPLPPARPLPYRFDLSQLLSASDIATINSNGVMVFHTVGDTGDYRNAGPQDLVAEIMTQDVQNSPSGKQPAFYYHLGDVIYFAGDIDKYSANFYETYKDYPGFIVAIPGNHDCQPDDPTDGPVDPTKVPLDGWVQNFMSTNPAQLGSLQTGSNRTQMDLPYVYWTFNTPFATIIGLFSNVGETEGEIHPDQVKWFQGELTAADPNLPLIVTVHHPPFSGDEEHSGSSAVDKVLSSSFAAVKRYPNLVLSGHVHNYQRFTNVLQGPKGKLAIPYIVAGAGGYTNLGKMQKISGAYPTVPLSLGTGLTFEQYDQENFGFLRLEISKKQITGTYLSAPYASGTTPTATVVDGFVVDLSKNTVTTTTPGATPAKAVPPKKRKRR